MLQHKSKVQPLHSNVTPSLSSSYSVPGKVFLLGEYGVLAGLPGLIATVGPRFQMVLGTTQTDSALSQEIHPHSPLGRLQEWAKNEGLPDLGFQFEDPFAGAGGFGASTAQFAMAYFSYAQTLALEGDEDLWVRAWNLYRKLMSEEPLIPSGADLVAQWQGGITYFDSVKKECQDLWSFLDWSHLLVFSATNQKGRKVPTHEHLALLSQKGFPDQNSNLVKELGDVLKSGIQAIHEGHLVRFGKSLNEYADVLARAGLEVAATAEDRRLLQKLPQVLGVKGTGAMQSDAVVVLVNPDESIGRKKQVIEVAESWGLRLVCDGLTCQKGVMCQN